MQVQELDHVVLNVSDVRRSVEWYKHALGLNSERLEEWERGEAPFVSLRIDGHTIIDLLETERSGENMNHLCLVVDDLDLDHLAGFEDFGAISTEVEVWGALGVGRSVYVQDPDANTIELRTYPKKS